MFTGTSSMCIFHLGVRFRLILKCGKLTNRPHGKVEGRAIVRIGRRDTIVHIQVLKARITTIVSIATTIGHTKPGHGSRNGNREKSGAKIGNFSHPHHSIWKKVKERIGGRAPSGLCGTTCLGCYAS